MPGFDPGPTDPRFLDLMDNAPGPDAYPPADFRVEWGPIFYRGRLDGSARLLVMAQDPGEHECIARRPLVGVAGRRVQGFIGKLGLTHSYVIVNAFLYCVYRPSAASKRRDDPKIRPDRDAWLSAIFEARRPEAVVTFGRAAEAAYLGWLGRQPALRPAPAFEALPHPTSPERSKLPLADAIREMLVEWNAALTRIHPAIATPDVPGPLVPYGDRFAASVLPAVPRADLPAGLPDWMTGPHEWAQRMAATGVPKRARIAVTVPVAARTWPA
jgi:hypothetical protein